MHVRKVAGAAFAVVVAVVGAASLTWACTPSAATSLSTAAGAADTPVRVNGTSFHRDVPVEIRWNSVSGPVLATATGPEFNVPVKVPAEAGTGVYYILALQRDAGGAIIGRGASAFDVIAGRAATGSPQPVIASEPRLRGVSSTPSDGLGTSSSASRDDRLPFMSVGVGLAAVGSAALFAGFTVVGVRRRRARAS